jgi:hypothetical protein
MIKHFKMSNISLYIMTLHEIQKSIILKGCLSEYFWIYPLLQPAIEEKHVVL